MRLTPLIFYDFMIIFLIACTFHDIVYGPVTNVSFAWPVCLLYFHYRRRAVAKLLDERRDADEDS